MKTFVRSFLFTGTLVMGANSLMASQASNSWLDQWYRAKYGRSSPTEEARQRAEQANTADRKKATRIREETTRETLAAPANTWLEQRYKAKYGRSSPLEEERRRSEGR